MEPLTVLVATEPLTYRDALAGALALLLPRVRVEPLDPDALDAAVDRPRSPVVVCSALTPVVEASACAWVVLYPGLASHAVVSVRDGGHVVPDPTLTDVLGVIREAADACAAGMP